MLANLIPEYQKVLKRLMNIEKATKEMTFNLLNIDDKAHLQALGKMTDEELVKALTLQRKN